jgi:hypothetical protein
MEYRRAYWDETPDPYLVERHEKEIFPLMRKRHLFAEVSDFLLYDFYTPEGQVNEDVFAYSNRSGDERSLVIYHNKYASTRGWIRTSAAYSVKSPRRALAGAEESRRGTSAYSFCQPVLHLPRHGHRHAVYPQQSTRFSNKAYTSSWRLINARFSPNSGRSSITSGASTPT